MKEIRHILTRYAARTPDERLALATVVRVEGSAYRRVGARMLVTSKGDWVGGISGGCLEGDALRRAQVAINQSAPSVITYDTRDDDAHQIGVGLGCNGVIDVLFTPINIEDERNPLAVLERQVNTRAPRLLLQVIGGPVMDGRLYEEKDIGALADRLKLDPVELKKLAGRIHDNQASRVFKLTDSVGGVHKLLFEFLRPEMRLFVVGDNYDVTALAGLSQQLGWELHVIGTVRKVSKQLFGLAKRVRSYNQVTQLIPDAYTAILLMSHDYKRDLEMLRYFLPLQPAYLGLLGPKKRTVKLQGELEDDLLNYAHTYSPTGLDIGAESPEEIALAILAEIVSVFRKRDARPLRERKGPIHAPVATATAVLILAAGQASRMGEPKQLLPWGETTLLGHAVAQAKSLSAAHVYVVTGAHREQVEAELRRVDVQVVHNSQYAEGMGTSIANGVKTIIQQQPSVERILITLADQPFVEGRYLQRLVAAQSNGTNLVATRYNAKRNGVPALFGKVYFEKLQQLNSDTGARELLSRPEVKALTVPVEQLVDLDTPELYARYRNG